MLRDSRSQAECNMPCLCHYIATTCYLHIAYLPITVMCTYSGVCACVILQVALLLIRERSRLVAKLLETRKHSAELEQQLAEERERVQSVSVELDRQLAECEQLCGRLSCAESLNRSLQAELNQLQSLPHTTAAVRSSHSPRGAVPTTSAHDLQSRPVVSEPLCYVYFSC